MLKGPDTPPLAMGVSWEGFHLHLSPSKSETRPVVLLELRTPFAAALAPSAGCMRRILSLLEGPLEGSCEFD